VTVHMKAVDVSPIKNVVDDRPVGVVYDSPVVIDKCYVDCHRQSQYLKWTVIDNVLLQPDSHRQHSIGLSSALPSPQTRSHSSECYNAILQD
jgi:hypothetical protein